MPQKKQAPKKPESKPLAIVGIGASAGGLAALKTFFTHVPENSRLAFVVVVHLSPDHESHLADLLQSHVKMPVQQVIETIALKPNHVYVIPPGCNLNTVDTHLRLSDLEEKRRERAPIDHFLRTLANTHDGNSVGIILTGTGSDGTLGIKEIKGKGGLTIVQDPAEAEYDGMPQSALSTGLVDMILPLAEIPKYIIRFANTQPKVAVPEEGEEVESNLQKLLQKVFAQVRTRTGRDFSRYKRSTILRRIQHRMQLSSVEQLDGYLKLLRERPEEVKALADDFLITVTNFFRDPEVYKQLAEEVIPSLFAKKGASDTLRIWSVGCATGEEAYSLAMLLLEEAGRHEAPPQFQIFASDLHEHSLKKAREGFYPGDIETDVSEERLKRFFVKEEGGYHIRKEVRELVVFAPHNLLSDPPFSRLDLILCRNVLIYLQREVQREVIELFHYALNPEGYLLLGTAESIEGTDLLYTEHKSNCLFRKRNVQTPEPRLPVFPLVHKRLPGPTEKDGPQEDQPVAYGVLHQRIVERYAPPSLLVSPDHKVVHLSEHVGRYLAHPGGEFTSNLFKLVREEFRIELRSALHDAKEKGVDTRSKPIRLQIEGKTCWVVLSVFPADDKLQKGFSVVIFDEQKNDAPTKAPKVSNDTQAQRDNHMQEMQIDLDYTKQQLQGIIEEYETNQEEMKASNEEMQSINEELRSTLEELETSKEELQSMNEELTTVNQENRHKVEELSQLSGDLQNLLAATDIATLFLDRQLRILRFTPRVGELFNIRMADRGRALSDYTHRLGYDELLADAQRVLKNLIPIEREVQDEEQRWYLTRVLPYRSTDDRIEGVVITFVDITQRMEVEKAMREHEALYRALASHLPGGAVFVVDQQLRYILAEGEALKEAGFAPADFEGKTLAESLEPERAKQYKYYFRQALKGQPFRWEHTDHGRHYVSHGVPLRNPAGQVYAALAVSYDLTEHKQAEEKLRRSEEHLRLIMESAKDFAIFTMDKERKITDWNAGAEAIMGYSKAEITGRAADIIFVKEDKPEEPEKEMQKAIANGRAENERWHVRKDGSRFWGSGAMMLLRAKDNEMRGFLKIMADNTERRQMEEALRQAKEEAERAAKAKEEFLAHMSHEIRTPLSAIAGLTTLLLEQGPQPSQLENLNALKFSAENLRLLINDILDFSKIQAGKISIEETDINLRDLLQSLRKAHAPRASEQGNELQFYVDDQLPEVVRTDQLKLSQVLNNLISNAVKFTRKGKVKAEVSLQQKKGKKLWVEFSVSDTGVGIPEEKQTLIFEAFAQADNSTVRQYEGTGLGLSITKLLLTNMESEIKIESKEGKGSRFYFTLPMKKGKAKVPQLGKSLPASQINTRDIRLLLVEDFEINRKIIMEFLQVWWQLVPDEAENGQEALAMVKKKHYDLILMDVRMPVMDGYQAAKAIRALPGTRFAQVPIIALTADTVSELKKHSEATLFTDVLTKPFEPKDLQKKIIHYATKYKQGTSGRGKRSKRPASKASGKPASSSANELDMQKLEDFLDHDTRKIRELLKVALQNFNEFQQSFSTTLAKRDATALDDMIHKKKMLLDMLGLHELKALLEQSLSLLQNDAPEDQIREVQQKGEAEVRQITAALENYLKEKR